MKNTTTIRNNKKKEKTQADQTNRGERRRGERKGKGTRKTRGEARLEDQKIEKSQQKTTLKQRDKEEKE